MKRKIRKINRAMSMMLVITMAFCLIGCGNNASPAVGDEVVVNGTEESNTEASTEIVESSSAEATEVTGEAEPTETEIPDNEVAGAGGEEKPAVMASPEPTAEPTPTPTVEPTPEPHVHKYTEIVTVQPTCVTAGEKKLTCECGDVKVESISATGEHNWEEQVQTEVFRSTKPVQVGTSRRTVYYCLYCYQELGLREEAFSADNQTDVRNHCLEAGQAILDAGGTRDEAMEHAAARGFCIDYEDPVYEEQEVVREVSKLIYVCRICGAVWEFDY